MADLDLDAALADSNCCGYTGHHIVALVAEVRRLRAVRDAAAALMNEVLAGDYRLDPAEEVLNAALDAHEGLDRLADEATAADPFDLDLLAEENDRLRAENERLRAIEAWAQDAAHHAGCLARHDTDWPEHRRYLCKCGRNEVMPRG